MYDAKVGTAAYILRAKLFRLTQQFQSLNIIFKIFFYVTLSVFCVYDTGVIIDCFDILSSFFIVDRIYIINFIKFGLCVNMMRAANSLILLNYNL